MVTRRSKRFAWAAFLCLSDSSVSAYVTAPPPSRCARSPLAFHPPSTDALRNDVVIGSSRPADQEDPKSRGWHRRVLHKVFREKKLNMQTAAVDEGSATADFMRPRLPSTAPAPLYPITSRSRDTVAPLTQAEAAVVDLANTPSPSPLHDRKTSAEGGSIVTRISRNVAQNWLFGMLDRWSKSSHVNMTIECHPRSGLDLLRGHFRSDAAVDFDRIVFPAIRMSGGRLEAERLALNLWSFTPDLIPMGSMRYPNQFDFVAHDITFTQADLFESNCIRNGLRRLLTRILKNRGLKTSQVSIDSIAISASGKVSCEGTATTLFGALVPFAVRSGLGMASRGHVLTFPGLELSINPALGLFVPVLPKVSLDLGNNARLDKIEINAKRATMKVSARATITPHHTLKLQNYIQSTKSYSAQYSVDVGRWLTGLGNFTN